MSKEVLVHVRYLNRELNMEREFLGKVEDNAAVQIWSEKVQQEKGDSLLEGYVSELWDFTRISVTQNSLQELKDIWDQWDNEIKQLFYSNYGDLPYVVSRLGRIQVGKAYSRAVNVPTFLKKLMSITGMSEQWVAARIKQKGDSRCIPWKNLRDLILAHPDVKKRVDIFALSIYGLVIFPKALGHVDEAVSDLFDRLDNGVTPVPTILAETFRSLNACRRVGEGRFIGCAQLFLVWFHSHFWKVGKVSYRVFSEKYSPLKELVATPRRDDITEEKWMVILQNLQEEDVEWKAPWMVPDEILYRCEDFDWVRLLGIWGAFEHTPLLGDNYKRKIREMSSAWKQVHRMKRFIVGAMTTPKYYGWWSKRVNDNIPGSREECVRSIEEHLQMLISTSWKPKKIRKGKNKAEEDLDSLKMDSKKLRLSIRTAGLGKISEQWRQKIKEEKTKADQWEKKFQDVRARESALEKNL
ncbi:hypothetical protein Gotri_025754 [Gossypium trilobum]|uniref:DUF7745 domain-containing protein n=2 Tax=Gossypium trilobum TaxID=34281 RepID=A0A7J9FUS4_9ROSI|nr:hypothetical protein [Gossypium trilobum]